ncbi:MAG: LVIVD repeat-containing protein, partial [Actinomycetota bacterium]
MRGRVPGSDGEASTQIDPPEAPDMRALRPALAALLVATALAGGGSAGAGPTAGGVTSDNVQYLSTVPFDAGTAWGARLVDNHLYVAGYRALSIYDVSDPLAPQLVSTVPTPTMLTGEDVDTNGEILVLSAQTPETDFLLVYNVEDKTSPTLISTLEGAGDHTITCVLDCKWAFGSNPRGVVVDLRNPAEPRLAGSWREKLGLRFVHDVTEVAPGRIVSASSPAFYLDARKKPADPTILATAWTDQSLGLPGNQLLPGSSRWPRNATDRFLLFGYESPFGGTCSKETAGAITTWDTRNWRKRHSFKE